MGDLLTVFGRMNEKEDSQMMPRFEEQNIEEMNRLGQDFGNCVHTLIQLAFMDYLLQILCYKSHTKKKWEGVSLHVSPKGYQMLKMKSLACI